MSEETQPLWVTIVHVLIILFAIIGVFSTVGAWDHWSKQRMLSSEFSISKNITIYSMDDYFKFTDTNGNGYITSNIFSFSRMDGVYVGHTYSIKYFCDPLNNNARTVMEMVDQMKDRYVCVTNSKGVCE